MVQKTTIDDSPFNNNIQKMLQLTKKFQTQKNQWKNPISTKDPVSTKDGGYYYKKITGLNYYKISDAEWKNNKLDDTAIVGKQTIGSKGCCLTATAEAISKVTGKEITPGDLDKYLGCCNGYAKDKIIFPTNKIDWNGIEKATGVKANRKKTLDFKDIDNNLEKDKPVIVATDYKSKDGSDKNDGVTDHWITIVGKETDGDKTIYYAVDNVDWDGADNIILEKKVVDGKTVLYSKDYRPIDPDDISKGTYKDITTTGGYVTFDNDKSKENVNNNTNDTFYHNGRPIVPDEA